VAAHEQHVLADHAQLRLVDTARAHPELGPELALLRTGVTGAEVAVAQTTEAVEQLHVPEVAGREDLLDRERRGKQVERVEARAGPADLAGLLVAVPELARQVGAELV